MKGNISAVAEAANRAEGKPREIDELSVAKLDTKETLKCIRAFYGLKDPDEGNAETIAARNGGGETEGLANNEDADSLDAKNTSNPGSSKNGQE